MDHPAAAHVDAVVREPDTSAHDVCGERRHFVRSQIGTMSGPLRIVVCAQGGALR